LNRYWLSILHEFHLRPWEVEQLTLTQFDDLTSELDRLYAERKKKPKG
jgi:hypothetical protein